MTTNARADVSSYTHQALKDMGNKFYAASQYAQAVQYYTSAISKQPNISIYYSNRALCYIQLQEYSKALTDCRQSIELDRNNLKAHFFAGQANLGLGQFEEALTHLVHSHNLALEQRINFGDDITSVIRLTKKKRFDTLDEQRKRSEIELQSYLHRLIIDDFDRQKESLLSQDSSANRFVDTKCVVQTNIVESCDKVCVASHPPRDPIKHQSYEMGASTGQLNLQNMTINTASQSDDRLHNKSKGIDGRHSLTVVNSRLCDEGMETLSPNCQLKLKELDAHTKKRINEVNDLFAQVDERRQKREVPDYLCGLISFEIMRDPVITPSGITYDRRSIIAHLHQVGHFDPISRQNLTEDQLIPNLAMKDVVNAFLDENPWAETF